MLYPLNVEKMRPLALQLVSVKQGAAPIAAASSWRAISPATHSFAATYASKTAQAAYAAYAAYANHAPQAPKYGECETWRIIE